MAGCLAKSPASGREWIDMDSAVWKVIGPAILAALLAGTGSIMALGRNNADRDYVDTKVEKSEQRIYHRLDRIEIKLDRALEK